MAAGQFFFPSLNRNAVTIKPKKAFVDWINHLYPDNPMDASDDHNTYLLHEMDSNEEIEEWLEENFDRIFQNELNDWHAVGERWPPNRTFKMFSEWFDWEISTMVLDMEDDEIIRE